MKEFDGVILIRDSDEYKKQGITKGMEGEIISEKAVNGRWEVAFYTDDADELSGYIYEADLQRVLNGVELMQETNRQFMEGMRLDNERHQAEIDLKFNTEHPIVTNIKCTYCGKSEGRMYGSIYCCEHCHSDIDTLKKR